jgi:hypothetical protein
MESRLEQGGVVMKGLYRCLAVATLLLGTPHIARAQEDGYPPPPPTPIPGDVEGSLDAIANALSGNDTTDIESVIVTTSNGKVLELVFATASKITALRPFSIGQDDFKVPKLTPGGQVIWYSGYRTINCNYDGSPGTALSCGDPRQGRRDCTSG